MKRASFLFLGLLFLNLNCFANQKNQKLKDNNQENFSQSQFQQEETQGIKFVCPKNKINKIQNGMDDYLNKLGIINFTIKTVDYKNGIINYIANPSSTYANTLQLSKIYKLDDEQIKLPQGNGKYKIVNTVSKKEIVLAMLQPGRTLEFKNDFCDVGLLKDQVNIRQNTIAWTENLEWIWPDGDLAFWNPKYWDKNGVVLKNIPLNIALMDVFVNPKLYSIGCNSGAKLIMLQGIYDYYYRIKKDFKLAKKIKERLYRDNDPTSNIDPEYDALKSDNNGKVLKVSYGIEARNIIPGDWIYFENTDPKTSEKIGYEGSNSLYLGRDKFGDYYNDNNHYYTYEEKIDEVYQWRNDVFSRTRDWHKIKPLNQEDFNRLSKPPKQGGLLRDYRVIQYTFKLNQNNQLIFN